MISKKQGEQSPARSDALLAQTLKNLAAILLRLGINAPRAERLLRTAFVGAAEAYARSRGTSANQSQIATISGVNRLDVRRILRVDTKKLGLPQAQRSRTDLVLAAWRNDAKYRDQDGQPRPLTFRGKNSEFARLIRKHGRDVTSKSILDQLLRTRAVTEKSGRLVITPKGRRNSTEMVAARADLKFLECQLRELRLLLGRRAYVSRRISVRVANEKVARRLQRAMLEKIQLMLGALNSMAYQSGKARTTDSHRVIVTANVATESDRESDEQKK